MATDDIPSWKADVERWRREEILIPLRDGRPVYRRKAWRKPNEDGTDRPALWPIGWGERYIGMGDGVTIPASRFRP